MRGRKKKKAKERKKKKSALALKGATSRVLCRPYAKPNDDLAFVNIGASVDKHSHHPGKSQHTRPPVPFSKAMASNPRKFSEKIALHNQKQAEETAAFEQIMKEVGSAKTPVHPVSRWHLASACRFCRWALLFFFRSRFRPQRASNRSKSSRNRRA